MKTSEIFIEIIPVGRANAISREKLTERLGCSDRIMRRKLQAAREDGALILNDQTGSGYYRADETDIDDLERQYWQDTARAMSILRRRKALRKILKEAGRPV